MVCSVGRGRRVVVVVVVVMVGYSYMKKLNLLYDAYE